MTFLVLAVLALGAFAFVAIMRPPFAGPLLALIDGGSGQGGAAASRTQMSGEAFDTTPTAAQEAAEKTEWEQAHRTPLVAAYGNVDIHSCIPAADLTGVLFHQASNNYALVLYTELPEADYEKAAAARSIRVNREQKKGTWLDADALHIWRTGDTTAMDTSIDIGAAAGTAVRAPVTGTVVLVRDYMLYEQVPDVEIHIQPDGEPDLDCVMIHTTDPLVKAGDHIEGGLTEVSKVRDIEKDLTDVQLSFFTPEGVGGNHVHVQMNDANYPDYRKNRLKGAIKVKR